MSIPIATGIALAEAVMRYVERQAEGRAFTPEEVKLSGDARRHQAALAQADADRIEAENGGGS